MKKWIAALLLLVLLAGMSAAPAQAMTLGKQSIYESSLRELENYLNGMECMPLENLFLNFSELGRYEHSAALAVYTDVLCNLEREEYGRIFLYLDVLRSNKEFCEFLENGGNPGTGGDPEKRVQLGTIEELENYARGRQAEHNGDEDATCMYYKKCMSFMDSMSRFLAYRSSNVADRYQEAFDYYRQDTLEGFQKAHAIFAELAEFDYESSEAMMGMCKTFIDALSKATPTPVPATATPAPATATPPPVTATPVPRVSAVIEADPTMMDVAEFEDFSVKVGTPSAKIALTNKVEFAGFTCEGGAWGQNGFEFTQEVLDALQPGTALEIDFESESGDMWIVLPDSAAGWMRVQMMSAKVVGNKAYITYEQIAEVVGEDKTQWGARLQCEASGNWQVYAVNVGKVNELVGVYNMVDFAGFTCSGSAWGQNGFEMTPEVLAALKPGCVVTISYESESGDIWLVFPDSAAGWMRVEMMSADCDGKTAQITWDELTAVLGEDVSTWGARMQCEGSSDWNVYAVNVGQAQ